MNDEAAIRERIEAFLKDLQAWNDKRRLENMFGPEFLKLLMEAKRELAVLAGLHGVSSDLLDHLGVGSPPALQEGTTTVACVRDITDNGAVVELVDSSNGAEHELKMAKGGKVAHR